MISFQERTSVFWLRGPCPNTRLERVDQRTVMLRASAIAAVGHIGPAAAEAVPKLRSIVQSGREEATPAIRALSEIGPAHPDVVPALISVLKDSPNRWQRFFAAHGLARIGPAAKNAMPTLLKILEHEADATVKDKSGSTASEPDLESGVFYAISSMGPAAKDAVPTILKYAASRQIAGRLRVGALDAISRLGPVAKDAVPDLVLMLSEPKAPGDIESVLVSIGKEAVPALIELIKRGDKKTGEKGLNILARIGPDAMPAREAIAGLRNHPELGEQARGVMDRLDKFRRP